MIHFWTSGSAAHHVAKARVVCRVVVLPIQHVEGLLTSTTATAENEAKLLLHVVVLTTPGANGKAVSAEVLVDAPPRVHHASRIEALCIGKRSKILEHRAHTAIGSHIPLLCALLLHAEEELLREPQQVRIAAAKRGSRHCCWHRCTRRTAHSRSRHLLWVIPVVPILAALPSDSSVVTGTLARFVKVGRQCSTRQCSTIPR